MDEVKMMLEDINIDIEKKLLEANDEESQGLFGSIGRMLFRR